MKKIFNFVLAAMLFASMAACNSGTNAAAGSDGDSTAVPTEETTGDVAKDEKPYKGNVNKVWTADETLQLKDICTVTFPAYHLTTLVDDMTVRANLYTPWEGDDSHAPMSNLLGNFTVMVTKLGKAQGWIDNQKGADERGTYKEPIKEIAGITIDGKKFQGFQRKGDATYYIADFDEEGYCLISCFVSSKGDDVAAFVAAEPTQKALQGIKFLK